MSESITITSERVDDIPVLLAQWERMGVAALLDAHFPTHGNWTGLSLGQVAVVWLTHILSQADHRLNVVQPWVEGRRETLQASLGRPVRALDVSDDRLAAVLVALSDDRRWAAFEDALSGDLVRVYDLRAERVRLDSTTASGHWQVTPDGLFQFGHSKDHRPDLPQVKVMLSALDPLGLPLTTAVLSGERADDRLYLPAIERVRTSLGQRGLLYVGDCKMAALETRAGICAGGDYYLCPLPAVQVPPAQWHAYWAPVEAGTPPLVPLHRERADGTREVIADGYETTIALQATVAGTPVTWHERRLVVRSRAQAQAATAALHARLAQAQAALATLTTPRRGKRRLPDAPAVQQAAAAIVTRYRVEGLVQVTCTEHVQERLVRGRGARPASVRQERTVALTATVDAVAVAQASARLGWHVYATNQPATTLPLAQAVLAYRDEYLVERSLGRLKGAPVSLTPMYLARDDHATGLIRLLTIAVRLLTLLEFVVRRALAQADTPLPGLYAGQPTRATVRPTSERLLAAFQGLTLTLLHTAHAVHRHLPPLTPLQRHILTLLGHPADLYTRLGAPTLELATI
jgi:transposase